MPLSASHAEAMLCPTHLGIRTNMVREGRIHCANVFLHARLAAALPASLDKDGLGERINREAPFLRVSSWLVARWPVLSPLAEGSAHDGRILTDAILETIINVTGKLNSP